MLFTTDVNYLAVIVNAILYVILGAIWYSPNCCGKIWCKEVKSLPEDKQSTTVGIIGEFVIGLVLAFVVALFVKALGITSAWEGVCLGFWAWLGFIATTQFSGVLWAHKSLKIYFVHVVFMLIALGIIGAVAAVWHN